MTSPRQNLGKWGESQAADYLARQGFTLLERNVRTPYGEIDLVVEKDGLVIFVEVKTRRSRTFGYPEESVNLRKQIHLKNSVEYYIQNHPEVQREWRVDVISIQATGASRPTQITHFKNVIS